MGKINEAIHTIHYLDYMSARDKWINRVHPLSKLMVTFFYILLLLSFPKYGLPGTLGMVVYPTVVFLTGQLPIRRCLRQLRFVFLIVGVVGIANPFFDREVITHIGTVAVTGGVVSMITLMLKGVLALLASYLLIITTSVEQLCYALRRIHIPKTLVTVLLLIYRYIVVLLKEAERIVQAYEMRAPGQKGIHIKVWGSLIGQLLLRSIDRAQLVYESMLLRGFDGEFKDRPFGGNMAVSIGYAAGWVALMVLWRGYFIIG